MRNLEKAPTFSQRFLPQLYAIIYKIILFLFLGYGEIQTIFQGNRAYTHDSLIYGFTSDMDNFTYGGLQDEVGTKTELHHPVT